MSSGTGGLYPANVVAGESAGSNAAFQPFPYPGTAAAANQALAGINNEYNPAGASALNSAGLAGINMAPGFFSSMSNNANNIWDSGYNAYKNISGLAPGAISAGYAQYGALAPYVIQALQAGFDPQNALYNRSFAQQQQQNQSAQAMAGVGNTPYGAGLTAQGNENFNIDWQNQQLARQAQGAQTAEGLSGTALNSLLSGLNTGGNLYALGENTGLNAANVSAALSQLGLSGYEGLLGAGGNALSQAEGLQGNQVQQLLQYLQASTGNAYDAIASQLGALNAGTSLYGTTAGANLGNQQLLNNSLGGLGSLGGTLFGNSGLLGQLGSSLNGSLATAAGGGVL